MPDDSLNRRLALNEKVMNLASDLFNMALGLYMEEGGREIIEVTRESWDRFQPFCNVVRSDAKRRSACDQDHYERARTAQAPCLRVCHAGMVNLCVPVIRRDGLRATLIGGEFRPADSDLQAHSATNFNQFVKRFGLDVDEAAHLLRLRDEAQPIGHDMFDRETLPKIQRIAEVLSEYLNVYEEYSREAEALAHNFSTEVRSVLLYVHQLRRVVQDMPNARRELKDASTQVLNAVTILTDIVRGYLASYEDSTVHYRPERIDALIRRAAATYQAEAHERNIELRFNLETTEPPLQIECSREHLLVALRNLIHNAIKYSYASDASQDRHRYVEIESRIREDRYEISVENYGVGIDPDEHEMIFQRGYQGRQTRREYRSGAGRGLPLARHYICDLHRGEIRVSSECVGDTGGNRPRPHLTHFTVVLPLKRSEVIEK